MAIPEMRWRATMALQAPPSHGLRVAIVRALPGLGDMLCAIPAWRALRAGYLNAHVTLIGLPQTRSLAARFGAYIDEFMVFPGYPGLKERPVDPTELVAFLSGVQGRFDLALQMHGSGVVTNHFTSLLGAKETAGFYLPDHFCPNRDAFLPYPAGEPEVWRNLHLVAHLGLPLRGDHLEFPIFDWERVELEALPEARLLRSRHYIVVHPGATAGERRWPAACFAAVADRLAACGYPIVLTGTAAERPLVRAVAEAMRQEAIQLAGRTTLGTMAVLVSGARLVLSNDTGISHLADALRVPSVIAFGGDVHRWAPLDRRRHRVVTSPSGNVADVALESVMAEVDDQLRQEVDLVAR